MRVFNAPLNQPETTGKLNHELGNPLTVAKITRKVSDSGQHCPAKSRATIKDRYREVFERNGYRPAIYGISGPQVDLGDLTYKLNKLDTPNRTIARLNKDLDGIVHYSRDQTYDENPKMVIQTFKDHILDLERSTRRSKRDETKAWGEYLKSNKDKLDPIIKLNKSLSLVESDEDKLKVVKEFCYKNTSSESDVDTLANFILDMILNKNAKDVHDINHYGLPFDITLDFSEMFVKHFFRNTSKLGLEFFASNDIHIVFSWGDGLSGTLDLDVIQDKKWKAQQHRFSDKYEPITFSEIRHVLRNPELFDSKVFKVHVQSIEPSVFSFADSLDSELQEISYSE